MEKIEALRKTIYNLENDVYEYNWNDFDSCNCGVLARTILGGKKPTQCGIDCSPKSNGNGMSGTFLCLTTNLPLPDVFQSVKDAGFSYKDMVELECLENEKILNRAGLNVFNVGYNKKSSLITYLKAWVEILEEEKLNSELLAQECDASKVDSKEKVGSIKIVYVSVPTTINESLPETILS